MLKQQNRAPRLVSEEEEDRRLPFDTRVSPHIRILNGALDEDEESSAGVILHGRLDPNTLRFLLIDDYQRPASDRPDIFEAMKNGIVMPSIEIGIRGQDFTVDGDDYVIKSAAYIIDGWQRVWNARRILELIPNHPIRLFATLHFGTDAIWERHRFSDVNKNIKKISPNLHLRNMRDGNEAIQALYNLSTGATSFPLHKRVSWAQNMKRGELISAMTFLKTALRLHGHLSGYATKVEQAAVSLLNAATKAKPEQFRRNIMTLYEVINECWAFDAVEFRNGATHVKAQFQDQLARLFSSHVDFWDTSERQFFVSADLRRKLAKFPVNDPTIRQLAGSGGAASNILYRHLIDHMNGGKRTRQLRHRSDNASG